MCARPQVIAGLAVVAELAASAVFVDEARIDIGRFVEEVTDIPSTCAAVRRLVYSLEATQRDPGGWSDAVASLRSDEAGRLLRTDPMVRRCQWRQPNAKAYDIVEAFVMGWGDARDALTECEQPGQTINATFLAMGIAAAVCERRTMLGGFFTATPRHGRILGLGAGRSPELDLLAPTGTINVGKWVIVDGEASEDSVHRKVSSSSVERRIMALPQAMEAAAANQESFDLIYMVDALDAMADDGAAVSAIEQALRLLTPNGRVVVSAFAADLPGALYLDGVLDWRPRLRDELMLGQVLARAAADGQYARSVWRGGSNRVVFGMVERKSWAT